MIADKELYERILRKKKELDKLRPFSKASLRVLRENFNVESTYNSNAIEGNTLTKSETKLVIEEGITIGGKSVREHFEAINYKKAIGFVESIAKGRKIDKEIICRINDLILTNIEEDEKGIYRLRKVFISGSSFVPAMPSSVPKLMGEFFEWLDKNKDMDIADYAALAHEKLVFIHPFIDGNGRAARLLVNLLLMQKGYPPIIILKTERKKYIKTIAQAQMDDNKKPFVNFIAMNIDRALSLWIDALKIPSKDNDEEYISLAEASKLCSYSQEYLSLLARRGKLESIKTGRNWVTTRKAIKGYISAHKKL